MLNIIFKHPVLFCIVFMIIVAIVIDWYEERQSLKALKKLLRISSSQRLKPEDFFETIRSVSILSRDGDICKLVGWHESYARVFDEHTRTKLKVAIIQKFLDEKFRSELVNYLQEINTSKEPIEFQKKIGFSKYSETYDLVLDDSNLFGYLKGVFPHQVVHV